MRVLAVYPKDWHINLEMSLEQLQMLLDFMDKCEYTGDLTDEKNVKAKDYVTKEFFPRLDKIAEDIIKGEVDGS